MLETQPDLVPRQLIKQGMYLRVPVEEPRGDEEFRDYRIGQVETVDPVANLVRVRLQMELAGSQTNSQLVECDLAKADRCRILPDTPFVHASTSQQGRVLMPRSESFNDGEFLQYYALIGGSVSTISEAVIKVAANRQDPDPWKQMQRYELHNPIWRTDRDDVVESYAQLRNATYGMEDLVGSRILLLSHQAEVVARVLSDTECRYLLADEVGLGKTIEASVILKALRRRDPQLRALIVVPQALLGQWHNELNQKFWLDFPTVGVSTAGRSNPGMLISAEQLAHDETVWMQVASQQWGVLIADEAHHLRKNATLYARIRTLSADAERVLILSATPIQRRAEEYLSLLTLLDPRRYGEIALSNFAQILSAQETIRHTIAYLSHNLTPERFDRDEFVEEMAGVLQKLEGDRALAQLMEQVSRQARSPDHDLATAKDAIAYVSENYRIESRVIRNRRATLRIDLPTRAVDTRYHYFPGQEEANSLGALYDYVASYLREIEDHPLRVEYCRVLLHSIASNPHALLALLQHRAAALETPAKAVPSRGKGDSVTDLIAPATPRQEEQRLLQLIASAPSYDGEKTELDSLTWHVSRWRDALDEELKQVVAQRLVPAYAETSAYRLTQVLRAIDDALREGAGVKILVFSGWSATLNLLAQALAKLYGAGILAQFHSGIAPERLQTEADKFQSDPSCAVLLCDELGGEGRNFQIAQLIVHVDLPWTPAQLEQRIGRVDRLGRSGTVTSVVPFADGTLEHDLFRIWHEAFGLFTNSMSGMEIALEGIQDELGQAVASSPRHGLAKVLAGMLERAAQLREAVEEERYFEEGAINHRRRAEFQETSEKYRDGKVLRASFMRWASLAGLHHDYDPIADTISFDPRNFNQAQMRNAKIFHLPNMEEALRRARRSRNLEIVGTFNRDVAIRREDLVFFAPGNDPWTDTIIANALEADRGRSCAILRTTPELERDWRGFELLYSLSVDPRPLYAQGYDPTHLFRAQGFLTVATYRLIVSVDGSVEPAGGRIASILEREFSKQHDIHLGKRDGAKAMLPRFKDAFPTDTWKIYLDRAHQTAERVLDEELEFMVEMAAEAQEEFERRAIGWRAAQRWLLRDLDLQPDFDEIDNYSQASLALVEGIKLPARSLESICFWVLKKGPGR